MVKELTPTDLTIRQPRRGGGTFSIVCSETNVTFTGVDVQGKPLRWAWDMVGGARQKSAVQTVYANRVAYNYTGANYQLWLSPDAGFCEQLSSGAIRLNPDSSGKLVLILGGL